MKVIDLLNKIANGEDVPEKIKYENYIYWYVKNLKDYYNAQVEYRSYLISYKYHNTDFLNDEVEIIEDTPKEDKKMEKLGAFNIKKFYDDYPETAQFILEMFKKQEEIIDKVNGE